MAALSSPRTAALISPRTAGLREPRTMAGWFWLGAGHSPDTGESLPSILVLWCLGGPRGYGSWPRARTAREWWCHRVPSTRRAHRIPTNTPRRARAMIPAAVSMPREEKGETKNFQKMRKQRGRRAPLTFVRSGILSQISGSNERGDEEYHQYYF